MDRRSFLSLVGGWVTWPSIAHAVSRPPIALRRLRLVNAHTGETFDGAYRDDKGPIEGVIDELCIFLRDHHSGQKTLIDVGVIDFLGPCAQCGRRDQSDDPFGLSHRRDECDARPHHLWRCRAQPAYRRPRARHLPRSEAFRCDDQSPGDAARRCRLVSAFGFYSYRYRTDTQLDPRRARPRPPPDIRWPPAKARRDQPSADWWAVAAA